jgi:DNA-directed RNA polymerase subunit K/omega
MIDRSKLPNSFAFVVTAGARARQLLAGSTPRVPDAGHKHTIVAQQEVLTGQVEAIERADLPVQPNPIGSATTGSTH